MEIYDDDNPRGPDCAIHSGHARCLAEMLACVGKLEATKPTKVKLLGLWSPRKAIESLKAHAVDGTRAALICINRETEQLVFVWADEPDAVYRLANLRARGYVLGGLVFNPDGSISCHPEHDNEHGLKSMLLGLFSRLFLNARQQAADADRILELGKSPDDPEKVLDRYSEILDRTHISVFDEINIPGTQTVQEGDVNHVRNTA